MSVRSGSETGGGVQGPLPQLLRTVVPCPELSVSDSLTFPLYLPISVPCGFALASRLSTARGHRFPWALPSRPLPGVAVRDRDQTPPRRRRSRTGCPAAPLAKARSLPEGSRSRRAAPSKYTRYSTQRGSCSARSPLALICSVESGDWEYQVRFVTGLCARGEGLWQNAAQEGLLAAPGRVGVAGSRLAAVPGGSVYQNISRPFLLLPFTLRVGCSLHPSARRRDKRELPCKG